MKLATTTGDYSSYFNSNEEIIKHIRKAGFKYVDYSFGMDFHNSVGIASNNPKEYLDNIKRLAEDLEIQFVQAHAPMGQPIVKDQSYNSFIEATKKSIEACAELGIKNIIVHSGYDSGISKEECFIRNKEFYNKLFPTAEKFVINILTENFNKMCIPEIFWVDNASDMHELIEFIEHPLFHCCWDTGHANMQEMPQNEELKILGKDVYALHVQDNFKNDDHHTAPFFGTLNLDSLMHGLIDIGYNGYFTFEADCMITPTNRKRSYQEDKRLVLPSIEIKDKAESLLYDIGKHILTAYNCFEE